MELEKLLLNDNTAACRTKHVLQALCLERYKQRKWPLKSCFSLLQVCLSLPLFVFSLLFKPSFNVLSGYFYFSLSLVAARTVWILLNFCDTAYYTFYLLFFSAWLFTRFSWDERKPYGCECRARCGQRIGTKKAKFAAWTEKLWRKCQGEHIKHYICYTCYSEKCFLMLIVQ